MDGEDRVDPVALAAILKRQALFVAAARNLLAHRDAGRKCDPEAIRWAEDIVVRFAGGAAFATPKGDS